MRCESSNPIVLKSGETGYWHKIKDAPKDWKPPKREPAPSKIDAFKLWKKMDSETHDDCINALAEELGVTYGSLQDIGACWSFQYQSWAFPMKDSHGAICGIRLRRTDGSKFSVPGSRQGIFIPRCQPYHTVFIPEGVSDVCALLSMGVYSIGRPSCSGGVIEIVEAIKRLRIERAVVICDADKDKEIAGRKYNPGYDGGLALSKALSIPHCVISLPVKDARLFLQMGGTKQQLESIVNTRVWKVSESSPETCSTVRTAR